MDSLVAVVEAKPHCEGSWRIKLEAIGKLSVHVRQRIQSRESYCLPSESLGADLVAEVCEKNVPRCVIAARDQLWKRGYELVGEDVGSETKEGSRYIFVQRIALTSPLPGPDLDDTTTSMFPWPCRSLDDPSFRIDEHLLLGGSCQGFRLTEFGLPSQLEKHLKLHAPWLSRMRCMPKRADLTVVGLYALCTVVTQCGYGFLVASCCRRDFSQSAFRHTSKQHSIPLIRALASVRCLCSELHEEGRKAMRPSMESACKGGLRAKSRRHGEKETLQEVARQGHEPASSCIDSRRHGWSEVHRLTPDADLPSASASQSVPKTFLCQASKHELKTVGEQVSALDQPAFWITRGGG